TYIKKNDPSSKLNIHMKLDEKTYIYMESFDNKSKSGYRFELDNFKGDVLTKKLVADEIKWDSLTRTWKLINYSVRTVDSLKETFMSSTTPKDTVLDMRPNDF